MKQTLKRLAKYALFRAQNIRRAKYECPLCKYSGPFEDVSPPTGYREHAKCPKCRSMERHRLQYLVMERVFESRVVSDCSIIHFAPESIFMGYLSKKFGVYRTADLEMKGVDYHVDLQNLPFHDEIYDFVLASHVLEHIANDRDAIAEIRRILKPGGIAILPVPIVADSTIEYPEPIPSEAYHVRAPGQDYFSRYEKFFSRIDIYNSDDFAEKFQLFSYEDRSRWPTTVCPYRESMIGRRHRDFVPVCFA